MGENALESLDLSYGRRPLFRDSASSHALIFPEFSTSSGFIIEGNRILTNAHAVEYGSLIQVKVRVDELMLLLTESVIYYYATRSHSPIT